MSERAPNLQQEAVHRILRVLDDWKGPLTWPRLIEAIRLRLHATYSRSALAAHPRIQTAFSARKKHLRETSNLVPTRAGERENYIRSLKAQLARVERDNHLLLERLVRWAANAKEKGLDEAALDRPLIPVDKAGRRRRGELPGSNAD